MSTLCFFFAVEDPLMTFSVLGHHFQLLKVAPQGYRSLAIDPSSQVAPTTFTIIIKVTRQLGSGINLVRPPFDKDLATGGGRLCFLRKVVNRLLQALLAHIAPRSRQVTSRLSRECSLPSLSWHCTHGFTGAVCYRY
jgi:hypothetical protein